MSWELAQQGERRRVSLPGYPFARERCWIELDVGEGRPAPTRPASASAPARASVDGAELMLLRPQWVARALAGGPSQSFAAHHVVALGERSACARAELRAVLPATVSCEFVEIGAGSLDEQCTAAIEAVFERVRGLLARGGFRQPELLQVVLLGDPKTAVERERLACFGAVTGVLDSARRENGLLRTQLLDCLDGAVGQALADRLIAEAEAPELEARVRYIEGRREVSRLTELGTDTQPVAAWRDGGVYLVTGGAGALGLVVANEIAATVHDASVILSGRSALGERQRRALDELRAAGLRVDYQRCDVARREQVARLLDHVRANYGSLTGIVHSAGVLDDGFVIRKSPAQVRAVLAPKIAGLVALDELSRADELDLFVCFSSIASVFGNAGQSDYAAANAFMDAYARYRRRLVAVDERAGSSVSINWPLWAAGGMGQTPAVREQLGEAGLAPLATDEGVRALRHALDPRGTDTQARLVVLAGQRRVLAELTEDAAPVFEPVTVPVADVGAGERGVQAPSSVLVERAVGFFRRMVARALKLDPERIDPDMPLERYGLDSVLAVKLTSSLERDFGELPRTLLFEVETLRELVRDLDRRRPGALAKLVGEAVVASAGEAVTAPFDEAPASRRAVAARA
ncbi:beta-ketoacyl reductase, partial [Enhygromyxa salina]|uniref:beta-ketoacyl reductase n=1 Tax=Enhygromyxa salina TaxID=215803 RepID=UPI0011BAC70C